MKSCAVKSNRCSSIRREAKDFIEAPAAHVDLGLLSRERRFAGSASLPCPAGSLDVSSAPTKSRR